MGKHFRLDRTRNLPWTKRGRLAFAPPSSRHLPAKRLKLIARLLDDETKATHGLGGQHNPPTSWVSLWRSATSPTGTKKLRLVHIYSLETLRLSPTCVLIFKHRVNPGRPPVFSCQRSVHGLPLTPLSCFMQSKLRLPLYVVARANPALPPHLVETRYLAKVHTVTATVVAHPLILSSMALSFASNSRFRRLVPCSSSPSWPDRSPSCFSIFQYRFESASCAGPARSCGFRRSVFAGTAAVAAAVRLTRQEGIRSSINPIVYTVRACLLLVPLW